MMDPGTRLYPYGFHPSAQFYRLTKDKPPMLEISLSTSRTIAPPMYYIIDFGISLQFPESDPAPRIQGTRGHVEYVPEFLQKKPFDPFKVDVWCFGFVIRGFINVCTLVLVALNPFSRRYQNTEEDSKFLFSFSSKLLLDKPEERPTAAEAVALLDEAVATKSIKVLRQYLPLGCNE